MDGDAEALDPRPRYRFCRLGLFFVAIAAGLMTLDAVGHLAFLLSFYPPIRLFLSGDAWQWGAGSGIVWSALVGSLLLRGCWPDPSWRRRSGPLALLALAGVVFWVLQHSEAFGLEVGRQESAWLRDQLRLGCRWAWMLLLASLGADVAVHLGRKEGHEVRASIFALVSATVFVWVLIFVHQTDWVRGWPLQPRRFLTPLSWPLALALNGLRGMAGFFLTSLTLLASRECSVLLAELDQEVLANHLFPNPSETEGAELLPGLADQRKS